MEKLCPDMRTELCSIQGTTYPDSSEYELLQDGIELADSGRPTEHTCSTEFPECSAMQTVPSRSHDGLHAQTQRSVPSGQPSLRPVFL